MEVKTINSKLIKGIIVISLIIVLINICPISANNIENEILIENNTIETSNILITSFNEDNNTQKSVIPSDDLKQIIEEANDNDVIILEEGIYKIHDITLTKNITFQGNGNARDIIIDGENKSSIFLIRSPSVYASFNNITFINGLTYDFGGVISMETGNVYVDNCIFINNTALGDTNAGAISNYGDRTHKAYLFVNNSLFVNNHADHDGGAVTTCYASSDIYNSVFISNSAHRDGGAIRVSVEGYGNVQDCIFMYNHADEWGGAYYSWAGESNIERCIFLNNTGGTNGGAIMVSGNLNLANSIIVNNTGGKTGGSFYIQQPMFDATTIINVHDNLITNNTSPYGKEIFIKWDDVKHLFTKFNNNDWGDEDPNDSSVIDPDKVTTRSKVTSTIKSNLLNTLDLGLLDQYGDLIWRYYPEGYFGIYEEDIIDIIDNPIDDPIIDDPIDDNINDNGDVTEDISSNVNQTNVDVTNAFRNQNNVNKNVNNTVLSSDVIADVVNNLNTTLANITQTLENIDSNAEIVYGNSTSVGKDNSAYEINKKDSVSKQASSMHIEYFIILAIIAFLALMVGYRKNRL